MKTPILFFFLPRFLKSPKTVWEWKVVLQILMKMHRKHTFDRRQWGHEILEKKSQEIPPFHLPLTLYFLPRKKHVKQCWKMFRDLFEGRTHVIKSLVGFVKWWVNRPCGYILVVDGRIGEMVERKPSRQRGFLFCTRVAFKHGLDWQIKNTDSLSRVYQ